MIDTTLQKKIYKPSNLMDLFNNTFAVLKYVWKDILILGAVVLGPIYALIGLFVKYYSGLYLPRIQELFSTSLDAPARFSDTFWPIYIRLILVSGILVLVLALAHGLVTLATYILAFSKIRREPLHRWQALSRAFRVLPTVILQKFLLLLLIIGLAFAFGLCVGLLAVLSSLIAPMLAIIIGIILYVAFICFLLKLMVSYSFTEQAILFEESSATESFSESASLVRGSWWRVFGISFLLSIVVSFVTQLVTSPLIGISLLPTVNRFFEFIMSAQHGNTDNTSITAFINEYIASIQRAMPLFFVSQALSVLISMLFTPIFMLLFYMDLRARKEPWKIFSEESDNGTGLCQTTDAAAYSTDTGYNSTEATADPGTDSGDQQKP